MSVQTQSTERDTHVSGVPWVCVSGSPNGDRMAALYQSPPRRHRWRDSRIPPGRSGLVLGVTGRGQIEPSREPRPNGRCRIRLVFVVVRAGGRDGDFLRQALSPSSDRTRADGFCVETGPSADRNRTSTLRRKRAVGSARLSREVRSVRPRTVARRATSKSKPIGEPTRVFAQRASGQVAQLGNLT
jgi:hypothetical protein